MRRVLFVDDEANVLDGLENALWNQHSLWEMTFVSSGELALRALNQRAYDVVIADLRMPGMSGTELLGRVRSSHPTAARVVLSGAAELELALRAAAVAHRYLTKPCKADVVVDTVERACQLRERLGSERLVAMVGRLAELPAAPAVCARLFAALRDENVADATIARIIGADVAIAAKVLQIANGVLGGSAGSVLDLDRAVAQLGGRALRLLAFVTGAFGAPDGTLDVAHRFVEEVQAHALLVARITVRLSAPERERAEDVFTAGLLHDVGRLVLAASFGTEYTGLESLASSREMCAREQALFGADHAQLGAYLLGMWGLPDAIVDAVRNHHEPRALQSNSFDLADALHIACALTHEGFEDGADWLDMDVRGHLHLAERLPEWRRIVGEEAVRTK